MTDNQNYDEDQYQLGVMDLALLIKTWGAKSIWTDLKSAYPTAYRELLYYALEECQK